MVMNDVMAYLIHKFLPRFLKKEKGMYDVIKHLFLWMRSITSCRTIESKNSTGYQLLRPTLEELSQAFS